MSENWTDTFDDLVKKFINADWTYQYSDDYSAYSKGRGQVEGITQRINSINWTPESIEKFKSLIIKTIADWYPNVNNEKYTESLIDRFNRMTERKYND